eukprot:g5361.t1
MVLQYYDCVNFETDPKTYLAVDPKIVCTADTGDAAVDSILTARYDSFRLYANVMSLLYPVGVPLAYLLLLRRHRSEINPPPSLEDASALSDNVRGGAPVWTGSGRRFTLSALGENSDRDTRAKKRAAWERKVMEGREDNPNIRHLAFLWGSYHPRWYMFEVFDMLRKLVLTALPLLLAGDKTERGNALALAMLVVIAVLAVLQLGRPLIDWLDNVLMITTQYQLFVMLFIGMCIKFNVLGHSSVGGALLPLLRTVGTVL